MNSALMNTLVVTGGTSGIGASLVLEASQRGYNVIFGGSRDESLLSDELKQAQGAHYFQVDVSDPKSMNEFGKLSRNFIKEDARLFVVASAGISERKGEDKIEYMNKVNVEGTMWLANEFLNQLNASDANRFVGLSSIVAAEGVPVPGDEAYAATKSKIQKFVTDEINNDDSIKFGSFALVPGAVDTPMTRKEMIYGLILLGAVALFDEAGKAQDPLPQPLLSLAGYMGVAGEALAQLSQADIMLRLLTPEQGSLGDFKAAKRVRKFLDGNEDLSSTKKNLMLASTLSKDEALYDHVIKLLRSADLAIGPEIVASSLLDQLESGELPSGRLLKVYSQWIPVETAPILKPLPRIKGLLPTLAA